MRDETRKKLKELGLTWVGALTMCANDLGEPGGSMKAGVIARRLCEVHGWEFTDKEGPICRRASELRAVGVRGRKARNPLNLPTRSLRTPIPKVGEAHPEYTKDDGFYISIEWRRLRYLALRTNGGRCECCGARSSDGAKLQVDHIIPRYKAPWLSLTLENLQVLCEDCNQGKGAWDDTDWRATA